MGFICPTFSITYEVTVVEDSSCGLVGASGLLLTPLDGKPSTTTSGLKKVVNAEKASVVMISAISPKCVNTVSGSDLTTLSKPY